MEQGGAQRRGVEPHAGADLRHADRVDDELLAGDAALVRVVLAGEHERADHPLAVDRLDHLVGVLGDDREQVVEQAALQPGEVDGHAVGRARRDGGPVDRRVGGHRDVGLGRTAGDQRALGLRGRGAARAAAGLRRLRLVHAAARLLWLVRYDSPSSRRRW
jgi:hypothetical protein